MSCGIFLSTDLIQTMFLSFFRVGQSWGDRMEEEGGKKCLLIMFLVFGLLPVML